MMVDDDEAEGGDAVPVVLSRVTPVSFNISPLIPVLVSLLVSSLLSALLSALLPTLLSSVASCITNKPFWVTTKSRVRHVNTGGEGE